ncbi:sigma-70 family RNA polymerase sigma factor [Actinoplanes solisilvae]|uniref:sigma-70 family RNA polymerase sigma factor n=1 Tax=Actinoplanes solisilvae TaxID=2486853 RepID=UPI0013E3EAAC|nr:sigma-70 family RNA polymerase sigma factor [Actinoplanes solisilvae]
MQEIQINNRVALLQFLRTLVSPGSTHTAEDLVQETMLRAWRHLDMVPAEAESQRRWLFTVARRLAIDAYRKRQTRPVEVGLTGIDPLDAEGGAGDAVVAQLTLRHAVDQLSAVHRSVLHELYIKGRTLDEAAAELGVPVGTVKSRAFYAVKSVRDALITD